MKSALIYYRSRKGTTKYYAEEIADFLKNNNVSARAISVFDFKSDQLNDADYVFLGCWTHGLFFILQHPDKEWKEFARNLPDLKNKKIALFTTYKIATGSMFSGMKKILNGKISPVRLILKSKNDKLTELHKKEILSFLE